jgi:hypothetical protein
LFQQGRVAKMQQVVAADTTGAFAMPERPAIHYFGSAQLSPAFTSTSPSVGAPGDVSRKAATISSESMSFALSAFHNRTSKIMEPYHFNGENLS